MKTIKAKVHRLPSEDYTSVVVSNKGELEYTHGEQVNGYQKHLYITTDEKIKDGDWCIDGIKVIKATPKLIKAQGLKDKRDWRKIIATTDPKLTILNDKLLGIIQKYPQIPQSFIEEYCKAGGIDEVLVEYVSCGECLDQNRFTEGNIQIHKCVKCGYVNKHTKPNERGWDDDYCENLIPKLDSNNCIIIHPVEEKMYSRKEVEDFAWKTLVQGRKATDTMSDIFNELPEWFDKWIEENI